MAIALAGAGYAILSLVGRRRQQVRKAAEILDVPCEILVAKEFEEYVPAELVVVAVPDDRIFQVTEDLSQVRLPARRSPTVLHTSGALSSSVFNKLAKQGWRTGSIHPLVSVSDPRIGAAAFRESFWCVEGDKVAVRVARRVVRDLSGKAFSIKSSDKPLYHAAAVMSSGSVTALFDVALEMLQKCGLSKREAQVALTPLVKSTIDNLSRFGPEQALTGPISRGDRATLKLHLSKLAQTDLHEASELYRLLGKHSLKLARKRISSEVAEEIERLLR